MHVRLLQHGWEYLDSSNTYVVTLRAGGTWAARAMVRGLDAVIGGFEVSTSTDPGLDVLGIRYISLSNTQFRASADNVLLCGDERPR